MSLSIRPEQTGLRILPLKSAVRFYRGYNRVALVGEHLIGCHLKVVDEDFHRHFANTCCGCCVAHNRRQSPISFRNTEKERNLH